MKIPSTVISSTSLQIIESSSSVEAEEYGWRVRWRRHGNHVIILVFFFFVIVKDNILTTRLFDFLELCHSHHHYSHCVVVVVLVFIGVSVDVVVSAMGIVHYCGSVGKTED